MIPYWKVAIFGTDTFKSLDSNHEIAMSSLDPTINLTDPEPFKDKTGWLVLQIVAADGEYNEDSDIIEVPGGFEIEKCTQRLVLNCELAPISVEPDLVDDYAVYDLGVFDDYMAIKNKRYKYFYNIDHPGTFHTAGKAVCVNIKKKSLEHDHDNGTKKLILEIRKIGVQ